MREIIKRNREALGMYDDTRLDNLMIDGLIIVNRQLPIGCMIEDNYDYTIADGLIVGFGI